MTNELDFIQQLRQQFAVRAPVTTGIGDDGAVLSNADGSQTVVVTDMLLDGVHFDLSGTEPALVGRKAIAVNLSDLAAMGCRPTAAFVSIAVSDVAKSGPFLRELYRGIDGLAEQYEFTVAGGDTNSWDGPFAINVCLTGVPFAERAVLRSGARPGDVLVVTGALGGSLQSGRHLSFEPRLPVAKALVQQSKVHAMMDISDGLAIDLHRMMESSGTGAVLQADSIPVHADVPAEHDAARRLEAAVSDGEDFELLIAMPQEAIEVAQQALAAAGAAPLIVIGQVTSESACRLVSSDGEVQSLPTLGWQH